MFFGKRKDHRSPQAETRNIDKRFRAFYWPTLQNAEDAKKAVIRGAGWALGIGIVTAAAATIALAGVINIPGISAFSYVDAAVCVVLAYFMFKLSRAAAIGALVLYVAGQLVMIAQSNGSYAGKPIAMLIILMFVNAVRGTYAYRRFTASDVSAQANRLHARA